jgi:glycosyltransferase involved in cell wall biosynthesis
MRVLHLASTFFPRHTGGKEVFIYQLIKGSPRIDHLVVYHRRPEAGDTAYDGIPVRILPEPVTKDGHRSYWSLVYDDLPGFNDTLSRYKPDLVHFHDLCAGASLSHLRACREAGIKTLVTYHAPGSSCMQKGLIRANELPCDGKIIDHRCTACRYRVKGVPKSLASILGGIGLPVDKRGRLILRNSTTSFHASFLEFFHNIDAIQVHANWVKELFLRNCIPEDKIHLIPMGGHASLERSKWRQPDPEQPLKAVFVGRCVNIKGVHLLVDAVKSLPPGKRIEVHFLGPYWDDTPYGRRLQSLTQGDERFKPPRMVPPETIVEELSKMDVCIIPSIWPETGPLSLFDAFAAGVPVIGTNHAGIAERVRHDVNGLLFEWGNSAELAAQLNRVLDDRKVLTRFKSAIAPNRTFPEMASGIRELYTKIIN